MASARGLGPRGRRFKSFHPDHFLLYSPYGCYNISDMFAVLLLSWWYSSGWSWLARRSAAKYRFISEALSVGILLRTFFAPWKQIQSTATLQNFIQTTVDNIVSRVVGMAVRTLMLFTALILYTFLTLLTIASFICWPIIPFLIIILPVMTLRGATL